MTLSTILKTKKQKKDSLLKKMNLKDSKKAFWLIVLNENLNNNELVEALKILPANFILVSKNTLENKNNVVILKDIVQNSWFDFIVFDDFSDNIMKFFNLWVIPIAYKKHHISSLLTEFNAKTVEWNAYIFEQNNLCDVYYAIIRYLENYKFPYDNKALVKNILDV